ncbi:MAG: hypothetical protein HFI76_04065 [Lachnospiraceae bacterium]|jgi:stage III sporulation protein AB|nr:hypothetical protein [Lachnospiraceae bacterium]
MIKIAGAALILSVSFLFGLQQKQRLWEHVKQLVGCKEMLFMLSGEMSYAKAPLLEAFRHISSRGKEPFGSFLEEVAKELETKQDQPLPEIWRDVLNRQRNKFCFSQEEFGLLESLGDNFGYLDVQMQLNHLSLCMQQLDAKIVQAQGELAAKQKLYQYLSVMCGLFFILILL